MALKDMILDQLSFFKVNLISRILAEDTTAIIPKIHKNAAIVIDCESAVTALVAVSAGAAVIVLADLPANS